MPETSQVMELAPARAFLGPGAWPPEAFVVGRPTGAIVRGDGPASAVERLEEEEAGDTAMRLTILPVDSIRDPAERRLEEELQDGGVDLLRPPRQIKEGSAGIF